MLSVVLSRIQQYTIWIDRRDKVLRTRSEDVSRTTGLERVPLPVVAYRMLGILIQDRTECPERKYKSLFTVLVAVRNL